MLFVVGSNSSGVEILDTDDFVIESVSYRELLDAYRMGVKVENIHHDLILSTGYIVKDKFKISTNGKIDTSVGCCITVRKPFLVKENYISKSYSSDILSYIISPNDIHIAWRGKYFHIEYVSYGVMAINGVMFTVSMGHTLGISTECLSNITSIGYSRGGDYLCLGFSKGSYRYIRLGTSRVYAGGSMLTVPRIDMDSATFKRLAVLKDLSKPLKRV